MLLSDWVLFSPFAVYKTLILLLQTYNNMTIRELKNNILTGIYWEYKEGKFSSSGFDVLASRLGLIYDSEQQLSDAIKSLTDYGYVKAHFTIRGGVVLGITPDGVEYVEENLLTKDAVLVDSLNDTSEYVRKGGAVVIEDEPIDVFPDREESVDERLTQLYDSKENFKDIIDHSVSPCFGVDSLADLYIKQLDKIAVSELEHIRMLGIFGPWGRGKTYFYTRLKNKLLSRDKPVSYKTVEFNAWKYQDTPSLWAYLYETLYDSMSVWQKFWLFIKSLFTLKDLVICFIVLSMFWLLYGVLEPSVDLERVKQILSAVKIPAIIISSLSLLFYKLMENPVSAIKIIRKYMVRKSYSEVLGLQNEIEKDLECLIKTMVTDRNKDKILLYVDDIDRCSIEKMIKVIESLRIILENKEIQKRVIVLCSVDSNKLIKGYCCQHKELYPNETELVELAREQLDKLFVFSIGLPPLDNTQYGEYLESLVSQNSATSQDNAVKNTQKVPPISGNRNGKSLVPVVGSSDVKLLDDARICFEIQTFLKTRPLVTPRKLRIMYYQLLFANNVIASAGNTIPGYVVDMILRRSIDGVEDPINDSDVYSDVIKMVVPY